MSFAQDPSNISTSFLSVAEKFDKHRGSLDDTNAFFSCNGYGVRLGDPAIPSILLTFVCSFRDGAGDWTNEID